MSASAIAVNCSDNTLGYQYQRWSGVRYNVGSTGTPYEFFAAVLKMLKDTGTFTNSGDGSGDATVIQRWGIIPPALPAIAVLDALITLPPSTEVVTLGGASTLRVSTAISAAAKSAFTDALPCLVTIQCDTTGITDGILLNIGGHLARAQNVGFSFFSAYLPVIPSGTITSHMDTITAAPTPGTAETFTIAVPGAEFDGTIQNSVVAGGTLDIHAYDTDDIVHISIGIIDALDLQAVQFLVMVNDVAGTDYYEADLIPSLVQAQVASTASPLATVSTAAAQTQLGASGIYNIANPTLTTAKPWALNPVPNGATDPVWTEVDIPKVSFLNVGLAGSSAQYSWKNVVGFQVIAVSTPTAVSNPVVNIGSIYFAGGYGPNAVFNSANIPLQPYAYLYTYRNPVTGVESNPTPLLVTNNYITPLRQQVKVILLGSTDNQVSGSPTTPAATVNPTALSVYRAGGSYTDGLYRFIGYAANSINSGGAGINTWFADNNADGAILGAPTVNFDNDCPVTSSLPVPFTAYFNGYTSGTGAANSFSTVSLGILTGPSLSDIKACVRAGTPIIVAPNSTNQETCVIYSITTSTMTLFFQNDHSTGGVNDPGGYPKSFVSCGSIVAQPCNLAIAAFDSIFIAGDQLNPMTLYKSKTGQPEYFPIVELETGIADQINVGSPSNPIMNITEYNGQILCMNLESLYIVQVFLGQMQAPLETPSHRGLYAQWAWCRVENEIWFLAFDGIYAWAGGQAIKKSEAIDPLFQGISIGPYAAIDLGYVQPGSGVLPFFNNAIAPKDVITMAYSKQRVYVAYADVAGTMHRLRYDILYDRWSVENLGDVVPANGGGITCQYAEQDVGFRYASGSIVESNLIIGKTLIPNNTDIAQLYLDGIGTSDGWVNTPNDGTAITYAFQPSAYTMGMPSFQKQFSDTVFELNNDAGAVTVNTYYDFSSTQDSVDVFSIPAPGSALGRRRAVYTMQNGFGKEAYAMQLLYSGSTTGTVTFYTNTFNYFSLDQIQVGRSFDWDDLGSPDDKRLYEVSIWYDAKVGPHIWTLDAITGTTNTQTVFQAVQNFTLQSLGGSFTGPTWQQVTFPISDTILSAAGVENSIVKKVRLRPTNSGFNTGNPFIVRSYKFNFEPLPPDIVQMTMWSDMGWMWDKIARSILLDIDTGNVPCTIQLQADGSTMQSFTVTTNSNDRLRILATNSNLEGRLWRLTLAPGGGGKAQLFRASMDYLRDVNAVSQYDSYWQDCGWKGWSAGKQMWVVYQGGPLTINFLSDGDVPFFSQTLPSSSTRIESRFYLPAVNNGVLNKSKLHRIQITSSGLFRLYANTRLELITFGSDQRLNFQLVEWNAEQQLQVAQLNTGSWTL